MGILNKRKSRNRSRTPDPPRRGHNVESFSSRGSFRSRTPDPPPRALSANPPPKPGSSKKRSSKRGKPPGSSRKKGRPPRTQKVELGPGAMPPRPSNRAPHRGIGNLPPVLSLTTTSSVNSEGSRKS